ncbi:hypothetical protein BDK51DRAFT_5145, partial [Blyttiomyces helicus]
EDYDRMKKMSFKQHPDIVVICFSIKESDTLNNVKEHGSQHHWFGMFRHYDPVVPIVLVGCRMDERHDVETIKYPAGNGMKPIPPRSAPAQGFKVAKDIVAKKYLEFSALTGEGVREVFDCIAEIGLEAAQVKEGK